MLYVFGFEKIGVVFGDMYAQADKSPVHGVRLEVRLLKNGETDGTYFACRPIGIDRPIWRADLIQTASAPPGTFDRTHHHPVIRGWEVGEQSFDPALSADPITWIGNALSDLDGLLAQSEIGPDDIGPDDARQLRETVPEILETLERLLKRVHAGELGTPPDQPADGPIRVGWM